MNIYIYYTIGNEKVIIGCSPSSSLIEPITPVFLGFILPGNTYICLVCLLDPLILRGTLEIF